MKCLLIETKDKRRFFTHEGNLPQLIEFSKTFDAEISIVKLQKGEVLDLEALAPAICDNHNRRPRSTYELIQKICPAKNITRSEILKYSSKIQKYITDRFLEGEVVGIKDVRNKFLKLKLTDPCLCKHIARCRAMLESDGYQIEKVGGGRYKIKS